MRVICTEHSVIVERSPGDKRIRGGSWGTGESALLRHVQRALNARGHDLVKRRMEADGHMMGHARSVYLRDRRWRYAIYDGSYAVRDLLDAYNEHGRVTLIRESLEG